MYEVLADDVAYQSCSDRFAIPPKGLFGGADGALAGPSNGEPARRARAMPAAEAHPLKGRSDGTTLYGDGTFSSFPGCSLNRLNSPRIRLSCLLS